MNPRNHVPTVPLTATQSWRSILWSAINISEVRELGSKESSVCLEDSEPTKAIFTPLGDSCGQSTLQDQQTSGRQLVGRVVNLRLNGPFSRMVRPLRVLR
jgi:hypothetical protein